MNQAVRFFGSIRGLIGIGVGILVVLSLLLFPVCFKRVTINAGEEGVIVSQPKIFGSQGVQPGVLTTGGYWLWRTNEVWSTSVFPQKVTEQFDDMITADSIPVHFGTTLNYKVIDVNAFIKSWGSEWYASNIQPVFRTAARDECKKYSMTKMISDPITSREIERIVLQQVQAFAKEKNIPIVFTGLNIGNISPKQEVMNEINQTAVQQQRQRTEGERKKAEDQRRATEISRAAADNAYREAMNLQPEQYIRLEAVKAYSHAAEECAKNDKCTMILTQPGNNNITVPIK